MKTVEMTREEINTFIFTLDAEELTLERWKRPDLYVLAKHKNRDGRTDILLLVDNERKFYYTRDGGLIWRII